MPDAHPHRAAFVVGASLCALSTPACTQKRVALALGLSHLLTSLAFQRRNDGVRFSLMGISIAGLLLRDPRWHSVLAVGWFALLVSHLALIGPHLTRSAA